MRIGLLTDLHYRCAVAGTSRIARRECRRVGEILERALEGLVAAGAGLLVCAGDCVDDETAPGVPEDLADLRARFLATGLPLVIVPGNHDPPAEDFYAILPRPPRRQRIGECQVLTFGDDPFDPQTQLATRAEDTLRWMRQALDRPATGGPTLLVQHYALYPEHSGPGYRHTYANDAAIRAVLEEAAGRGASAGPGRLLALSGHNHRGSPLTTHRGVSYLTGRALCEHPFPYYLLHTQGSVVRVEERTVAGEGYS
ncbi:MAG TPA: metallophosphoesterase [Chloroflexota bacterium]|nr:metallophosphoesterase [Chloroflexota bacterium]